MKVMLLPRKLRDGTYTVLARVTDPKIEFYGNPDFRNLTKDECNKLALELIEFPSTLEELEKLWYLIEPLK